MITIKNKTIAGASKFKAVPPIVWSAFKFIDAKASNRANIPPQIDDIMLATINILALYLD